LPPEFDRQRKQGFGIPLGSWLQSGAWKDFFQDTLLHSTDTIFEKKSVQSLLKGQANGRNNTERLFALTMFELWRKEYNVLV
jgi:asparagine synthase (glutamine-hydrolysing)